MGDWHDDAVDTDAGSATGMRHSNSYQVPEFGT